MVPPEGIVTVIWLLGVVMIAAVVGQIPSWAAVLAGASFTAIMAAILAIVTFRRN
jgi:hypothetical protein